MSDYSAAEENGINFIARVSDSENDIFKGMDAEHIIADLSELHRLIE